MGGADRFYSARFYSVTRAGNRVPRRVERLAAVGVALAAALLLGAPSSDDATGFDGAEAPSASAAPRAVAATTIASAPCGRRDGATCTEIHNPEPSYAPKPPVRWNPFPGR